MRTNFLQGDAYQVFSRMLGNETKIKRNEKLEDKTIKTEEAIPRKIEISVYKLEQKPEYELRLKIDKGNANKYNTENEFELIIEGISINEMRNLYKNFSELYKKIRK